MESSRCEQSERPPEWDAQDRRPGSNAKRCDSRQSPAIMTSPPGNARAPRTVKSRALGRVS